MPAPRPTATAESRPTYRGAETKVRVATVAAGIAAGVAAFALVELGRWDTLSDAPPVATDLIAVTIVATLVAAVTFFAAWRAPPTRRADVCAPLVAAAGAVATTDVGPVAIVLTDAASVIEQADVAGDGPVEK